MRQVAWDDEALRDLEQAIAFVAADDRQAALRI